MEVEILPCAFSEPQLQYTDFGIKLLGSFVCLFTEICALSTNERLLVPFKVLSGKKESHLFLGGIL